VEFVVEGKSIHAHKMLLILRCDYFKSMFSEGSWKESKERLVEVTESCYSVMYLALICCLVLLCLVFTFLCVYLHH